MPPLIYFWTKAYRFVLRVVMVCKHPFALNYLDIRDTIMVQHLLRNFLTAKAGLKWF